MWTYNDSLPSFAVAVRKAMTLHQQNPRWCAKHKAETRLLRATIANAKILTLNNAVVTRTGGAGRDVRFVYGGYWHR